MRSAVTVFLALACVLLTAAAQIVLKIGVSNPQLQSLLADGRLRAFLLHASFTPLVFLGVLIYVVSTVIWLLVLARADLSYAYPFVSLGFVATALYGFCVLHEPIGAGRLGGIALIVCGVLLIARS
jgi:multidrug transporter EmrE-like cation transporter